MTAGPGAAHARGQVSSTSPPTVRLAQVIGADDLSDPDPTEDYHEASRMYPGIVDPTLKGAALLERSAEMRVTASRSVKRHAHRPALCLPPPDLGSAQLADAMATRRSARGHGARPISLEELSSLLHAAYGVTGRIPGTTQELRTAPSGGALYPLELYTVCAAVEGVDQAVHHYDPLRHALELLRPLGSGDEIASLTPYEDALGECALVVVMTAMFWRSRFKYGARAYRFTLIEAGHVAQNVLLAATALRLRALPLGGFYDRRVDALLGIDGLHEASLYLLALGSTT